MPFAQDFNASLMQNPAYLAAAGGISYPDAVMAAAKQQHDMEVQQQQQYFQQNAGQIMQEIMQLPPQEAMGRLMQMGAPDSFIKIVMDQKEQADRNAMLQQLLQGGGANNADAVAAAAAFDPRLAPLATLAGQREGRQFQAQQDVVKAERDLQRDMMEPQLNADKKLAEDRALKKEAAAGLLRALNRVKGASDKLGDASGPIEGIGMLQDALRVVTPERQAKRDEFGNSIADVQSLLLKARYGNAQLSNADLEAAAKLLPNAKQDKTTRDAILRSLRDEALAVLRGDGTAPIEAPTATRTPLRASAAPASGRVKLRLRDGREATGSRLPDGRIKILEMMNPATGASEPVGGK